MLMSSDDGGVDHRVFVVRIVSQSLEKTSPIRRSSPTARTACECSSSCRSARADRATAPPSGISKSPPQRKADCPTRYSSDMPRTTRQQMFNPRKLVVAQSVAPHRKPPKKKAPYKSRFTQFANPLIEDTP